MTKARRPRIGTCERCGRQIGVDGIRRTVIHSEETHEKAAGLRDNGEYCLRCHRIAHKGLDGEVRRLQSEGLSVIEIARKTGFSRTHVYDVFKRLNTPVKSIETTRITAWSVGRQGTLDIFG